MAKNKNRNGRDDWLFNQFGEKSVQFDHRRAKRRKKLEQKRKMGEGFEQSGEGAKSFEEKLATKRERLGLSPLNLDDVIASQQEEIGARTSNKHPVKPENILPIEPDLVTGSQLPTFQELMEKLEQKEQASSAENFSNQLIREYSLNDELATLLRNHLSKIEKVSEKQEAVYHLILKRLQHYVKKDFFLENWQRERVLDYMLQYVNDHGYENLTELEINLVMILRINDLSLDEELNRQPYEYQDITTIQSDQAFSAKDSAEKVILDETTPEIIIKNNSPSDLVSPSPLPAQIEQKDSLEVKRFSEIIEENSMDDPLVIESPFGRFIVGSDKGFHYKTINEDRVLLDTDNKFFAVIDGLGGHRNGDVAAHLLAEKFLANSKDEQGIRKAFEETDAVIKNKFLSEKFQEDKKERLPDSCVIACHLEDDILHIYQAGDVRMFIKDKNGNIRFNSFDQGLGYEVTGTVSNVVTGISNLKIDKVKLFPGDQVFVMTDGVSDNFQKDFDFDGLNLSPLNRSVLWAYLYANGNWDILKNKYGGGFYQSYYDFLEGRDGIIPHLQEIYLKVSKDLSAVFSSDDLLSDYKKLSKILENKMQTDGKPDNRSLLVFEYQASNDNDVAENIIDNIVQIPNTQRTEFEKVIPQEKDTKMQTDGKPDNRSSLVFEYQASNDNDVAENIIDNIVQVPNTQKTEFEKVMPQEKENSSKTETLSNIAPKLSREYQYYAEQVNTLEMKILELEDRNRIINAWSHKQNPDWHNQDDKLTEYGDLCREYTLNMQQLRDLDAKIARSKVLLASAELKIKALLNAQTLGLPLTELATQYENEAEDLVVETKNVKVVLSQDKISEVQIVSSAGEFFGDVRVEDKDLDKAMNAYVQAQRHFISKDKAKNITPEDNKDIDKVFRLDYLSRYVDYSSFEDESGKDQFGKKLDQKYFEIHQRITEQYKILLPTRKANIPLYFDGNRAYVPMDYVRKLYLYNRENSPELKNKLDKANLSEKHALAWVETILLGQIMRDSTITLTQLSAIKYRLNKLLEDNSVLREKWIPMQNKELITEFYPYLKVEKNWFQSLPLDVLKEKVKNNIKGGGIFEYQSPRFLENNIDNNLQEQEVVKQQFIDALKKEILKTKEFSPSDKKKWLEVTDKQILKMLQLSDTPNMKSIINLFIKERDQYLLSEQDSPEERQNKIAWYQFYDGLVKIAKKIT